jgi:hypothetical protein
MSPAGAGVERFRESPRAAQFIGPALVVVAVGLVLLLSGGSRAHASPAPIAALSPAWAEFQRDCVAGPAPGQGSAPEACVCWEQNLVASAIVPGYAVDSLNAARVGGGPAYTVSENLAGGPVGWAGNGCGLR